MSNFSPKSDVEAYLDWEFNIKIYEELTENKRFIGLFEPLEFFNLLYENFELLKLSKNKPLSCTKYLLKLNLSKQQLHFFLSYLIELISFEGSDTHDNELESCYRFINKEYNKLDSELFPHDGKILEKPSYISVFDFDKVLQHLETLPDTFSKIRYLTEVKTEYLQNHTTSDDNWSNSFGQKCDYEAEKLKALSKLDHLKNADNQAKIKSNFDQFTNSQLVLIFYYFFKQNGLEPRRSIDIAPMAKFIHLITGKDFKSVQNSDIYKKLQKVPNFKTDKNLIPDLKSIKHLFEKYQMNEIVKMIDNEIDLAHNIKKPTNKTK